MRDYCNFSDLVGKVFSKVQSDDTSVTFLVTDNDCYTLEHQQDCCESVWLDDVCGDLSDLENSPILVAEQISNSPEYQDDDFDWGVRRWTFYRLQTAKGAVTLRFCGTSNGYYSVGVDLNHYSLSVEDEETDY